MKRLLLGIAVVMWLAACTRDETPQSGASPALVPPPAMPTEAPMVEDVAPGQTPIAPIIPTPPPGDNVALCRSLRRAGRLDIALRPCLLALQADPGNEELIAAVKEIQQSVADSMPTPVEKEKTATAPQP